MPWIHLSNKPVEELVDDETCSKQYKKSGMKPFGLWLGMGNDWLNWLESEMPNRRKDVKYKYAFYLKRDANLLIVDSVADINNLIKNYGDKSIKFLTIKWKEICKEYDGVIFRNFNKNKKQLITPYMQKDKINLMTYHDKYGWYDSIDVDSACIFRPSKVVSSYKLIK